ncbi:hypothetical protein [Alteromonas sp. A079]|uniref:hypothetical protein n=1 Tax=Alteromonas sp. A079 TaxID=3410268 RepID=UPI003BA377E0
MINKQKNKLQELQYEFYTNVYGGIAGDSDLPKDEYHLDPEKPKKPGTRALHHEPFHTGIFGS